MAPDGGPRSEPPTTYFNGWPAWPPRRAPSPRLVRRRRTLVPGAIWCARDPDLHQLFINTAALLVTDAVRLPATALVQAII
jgi:hypothetical protein